MFSFWVLLASVALVNAWLPGNRTITSKDGRNLFLKPSNTSSSGNLTGRWLPNNLPIRGVNLGSMFIVEPWMASTEWSNVIGCGNEASEFDCVLSLGQATANSRFAAHWGDWITQSDISTMVSYGLNTIRVPVGYWIWESLKYSSEYFPDGGLAYLTDVVGWASDAGMYIVIDLHGAPFAQQGQQPFTGQMAANPTDSNPDFYQPSQYQRALWFLGNMTHYIHTNNAFRNVGMIEVVNEPLAQQNDLTNSMRSSYYPEAFSTIRGVENGLGISSNNYLHIQMMDALWGSGDPTQYLTDNYFAAYDDHNYVGYNGNIDPTPANYLAYSCADNRGGNSPVIVGEWSLTVSTAHQFDSDFWPISNNLQFYQNWFNAQVRVYEKQDGWIFWSWKTNLGDPRWDYQGAVQAGIIPKNLNTIYNTNPCS